MDGFSKPTIQTVNYLLELRIDQTDLCGLVKLVRILMNGLWKFALMETFDIGWAWWNHKKIGSIKGPISMTDPVYKEILDF